MSIKGEIERAVRIRQRGTRISTGDQFWRGVRLVTILSVGNGKVRFRDMGTGSISTTSRNAFVSVALGRVAK